MKSKNKNKTTLSFGNVVFYFYLCLNFNKTTMENKSNQCRECGGNGKLSKAFRNVHNIQYPLDGSKAEFEINLIDCIKCENCGHSWIPQHPEETSTRQQALAWWNTINGTFKQRDLGLKYYPNRNGLTGREIEEIWKNEVQVKILSNAYHNAEYLKANQKQFKRFDESLFKAYINKFSDEDKLKMLNVLFHSQNIKTSMSLGDDLITFQTES